MKNDPSTPLGRLRNLVEERDELGEFLQNVRLEHQDWDEEIALEAQENSKEYYRVDRSILELQEASKTSAQADFSEIREYMDFFQKEIEEANSFRDETLEVISELIEEGY